MAEVRQSKQQRRDLCGEFAFVQSLSDDPQAADSARLADFTAIGASEGCYEGAASRTEEENGSAINHTLLLLFDSSRRKENFPPYKALKTRDPRKFSPLSPEGRRCWVIQVLSADLPHAVEAAFLPSAACAAASRAIGTRKGEHDT